MGMNGKRMEENGGRGVILDRRGTRHPPVGWMAIGW